MVEMPKKRMRMRKVIHATNSRMQCAMLLFILNFALAASSAAQSPCINGMVDGFPCERVLAPTIANNENSHPLVPEVPHAGEYHCHFLLIGSGDDFIITL